MKYVIVKSSKRGANRTYTGPTWEMAGITPPTEQKGMNRHDLFLYDSKDKAQYWADRLSVVNPVGFIVEEYQEE